MTLGNKKAQRRNHRRNNKGVPKQPEEYRLIDGNWSNQPFVYCTYHKGYMTRNQTIRHHCLNKKCPHYHTFEQWKNRPPYKLPEYKFPSDIGD